MSRLKSHWRYLQREKRPAGLFRSSSDESRSWVNIVHRMQQAGWAEGMLGSRKRGRYFAEILGIERRTGLFRSCSDNSRL